MKLKKENKETFQGIGPGKAISDKTPKAQQAGGNMNRLRLPKSKDSVNYTADNN